MKNVFILVPVVLKYEKQGIKLLKPLHISIVFLALGLAITPVASYGSHGGGSGGSGGCSGDCIPPTMGKDDRGWVRVSDGLTINSEPFTVESFSQTIPTQIFKIGEKVNITLKIYENTSPEFLIHAELHFNMYDKFVQGIKVEESTVSIVWDDTGGDEVYGVYGEESLIKNVSINQQIEEGLAIITFEFEFAAAMDTSTLMTTVWDEKRNSIKNYFYEAFVVIDESESLSNVTPSSDEISPEQEPDPIPKSTELSTIPSSCSKLYPWWAEEKTDDSDFINGLQYMIDRKIITIPQTEAVTTNGNEIPGWIKNTAGWWAEGMLSDDDFVKGIQYMITNGIIHL